MNRKARREIAPCSTITRQCGMGASLLLAFVFMGLLVTKWFKSLSLAATGMQEFSIGKTSGFA